MEEILNYPSYQLILYCLGLVVLTLIYRFDATIILITGTFTHVFWVLVIGTYAIRTSLSWLYFIKYLISVSLGYLALWCALLVIDKWGDDYNSEGAMILSVPLVLGGPFIILVILAKALWQLIKV
jgi:hypothetical protein